MEASFRDKGGVEMTRSELLELTKADKTRALFRSPHRFVCVHMKRNQ